MGEVRRWAPGDVILWRDRRDAQAARVVRDDEDELVAWIAPGPPRLAVVPVDGHGGQRAPPFS